MLRSRFPLAAALSLALVLGATSVAEACVVRPVDPGGLGLPGLQDELDAITSNGPGIDAVADQFPGCLFHPQAGSGSVVTIIVGTGDGMEIGLYDGLDPTNKATIFSGATSQADQALLSFFDNGDVKVNLASPAAGTGFFSSFGFYLTTAQGVTFYTEDVLNGQGLPQALVYRGDNETELDIGVLSPGTFSDSHFIFAFEDTSGGESFDDVVFLVESLSPAPEPATIATTGLLLGIGLILRRRRKSAV